MSLHHLLLSSQNEAIEDKYTRNILYRLLHIVCEPIAAESVEYEVRSGELFYHCVYTLDSLRGCAPKELVEKSMVLWDEMLIYCANKGWDRRDKEVRHWVFLIVYSVARSLFLANDVEFIQPKSILINRLQSIDPQYCHRMTQRFNKAIDVIGKHELGKYLCDYMQSSTMLSDEIESIIDANTNVGFEQTSPLSIDVRKAGRQQQALFSKSGKEDTERTATERDRFMRYLRDHKSSQKQFDSKRDNPLMKIIVSFYLQWRYYGYVSEKPNGMAVYRFLKESCKLQFSVTDKAFANTFRSMVQDNDIDNSTNMDVKEFFNRTI